MKILVNNHELDALEGETLAVTLWANGLIAFGHNTGAEFARGIYCGIGHCYECRVTVDGIEDVRSCLTPVREGMQVTVVDRNPLMDGKEA